VKGARFELAKALANELTRSSPLALVHPFIAIKDIAAPDSQLRPMRHHSKESGLALVKDRVA
jgi:hypothetical protein